MNQADNHGYTPLHATSFNGQVEVVKALIVARADLHHVNDYDNTALSLAIIKGHDDVEHFLKNEINWLRLRPLLLMRPHEDKNELIQDFQVLNKKKHFILNTIT